MTASDCCTCQLRHNPPVNAPHQLHASERDALRLNQPLDDPKRNCTYREAEDFHVRPNRVAIYSDRVHPTHHVRHRCTLTIFLRWKRVEHSQPGQRDTINCHVKLSAFVGPEVAEDVVVCYPQAQHIDTHRKYSFRFYSQAFAVAFTFQHLLNKNRK